MVYNISLEPDRLKQKKIIDENIIVLCNTIDLYLSLYKLISF